MSKPGPLTSYSIRKATEADLPAILDIYNDRIRHDSALFIYDPIDLADRTAWYQQTKQKGYPVIVAVDKATGNTIAYGSLGEFRSKPAYILSAELSVYIHPDHHRRGLGRLLVEELIAIATKMQLRSIIAGITSENDASIKLFTGLGFTLAGTFRDVGYKFNRYLNVSFYDFIVPREHPTEERPRYISFPWDTYEYKSC